MTVIALAMHMMARHFHLKLGWDDFNYIETTKEKTS